VYQIKVTLKGSRPPIWCRLQAPSDTTLAALARAVPLAITPLQPSHVTLPAAVPPGHPCGSAAHCLAASRSGGLPRRAGDVAIAAGKGWRPAGGARSVSMPFILPNSARHIGAGFGRVGGQLDHAISTCPLLLFTRKMPWVIPTASQRKLHFTHAKTAPQHQPLASLCGYPFSRVSIKKRISAAIV